VAAQSGELFLELKRVLPASPSVVFEAISDPSKLAQWWGPQGFTNPSVEFRPRVAERYRIEMQPPDAPPFHVSGVFREVDPPLRLAFTFAWEEPHPDDVETRVELSFRDLGNGTEVIVTQGAFQTDARRELHRNGWTDSLDKLARLLARA
jgi:uncharacterized protein YndB with AHSA1/START domain